ncbi:hypothetical protein GCM10027614_69860 [Micromonospora vulcania]
MPVVEVGGNLQRGGTQRDQAEVVTERIMHLPGDPGPFPQPDPLGGTALLTAQRVHVSATGVDQLVLLPAVATDQPRKHPGEEQHRGEQEPRRRTGAEQHQVQHRAADRDHGEQHGGRAGPALRRPVR